MAQPLDAAHWREQAQLFTEQARYEAADYAWQQWEASVADWPQDTLPRLEVALRRIKLARQAGDYTLAEGRWRHWQAHFPDHTSAAYLQLRQDGAREGVLLWDETNQPELRREALDHLVQLEQQHPQLQTPGEPPYMGFGLHLYHDGRFPQALTWLKKGTELVADRYGPQHLYTAQAYVRLGRAHERVREFRQAEWCYQRALAIYQAQVPQSEDLRQALNQLGVMHWREGNFEEAETRFQAALRHARQHRAPPQERARLLDNLGLVYQVTDRIDEALMLAYQALDQFRADSQQAPMELARSYHNLTAANLLLHDYEEAVDLAQRAFAIKRQLLPWHHRDLSHSCLLQAEGHLHLAQYAEAERLIRQGFDHLIPHYQPDANGLPDSLLVESLRSPVDLLEVYRSWLHLTLLRPASKAQWQSMLRATRQARQVVEQLLQWQRFEADHLALLEDISSFYGMAIVACENLYQRTKETAYLETAWRLAEKSRHSLLRRAWLRTSQWQKVGVPDSLRIELRQLERSINRLQRTGQDSISLLPAEQSRLNALLERYDDLRQQLRRDYPAYAQVWEEKGDEPMAMPRHSGETWVRYLYVYGQGEYGERHPMYGQQLIVLSHRAGKMHLRRMNASVVADDLDSLLAVLSDTQTDLRLAHEGERRAIYQRVAWRLYQRLLAPELEALGEPERLVVLADGELAHLPFEALLRDSIASSTGYRDLPYLLHEFPIHYRLLTAPTPRVMGRSPQKPYLGLAPEFGAGSPLMASLRDVLTDPTDRSGLRPLRYNREEVRHSAALWQGEVLAGAEATEQRFKSQADSFRVLHLASHGFFDVEDPFGSGIMLSPGAANSGEDGILYAHEILGLELPVELVVLSACQTGVGSFTEGEGVLSLGYAFRRAGAQGLVQSVWQADDRATDQLMQIFFAGLRKGLRKDEALRAAKRAYLAQAPEALALPFYWAPFLMVGEAHALPQATPWYVWGGLGLLSVLLLLSLGLWYGWRIRKGRT